MVLSWPWPTGPTVSSSNVGSGTMWMERQGCEDLRRETGKAKGGPMGSCYQHLKGSLSLSSQRRGCTG